MSKPREFDHILAAKYGRELFGGFRDTIGEAYIVQAMRKQFDIDYSAYEKLEEKLSVAVEALEMYANKRDDGQQWIAEEALAEKDGVVE